MMAMPWSAEMKMRLVMWSDGSSWMIGRRPLYFSTAGFTPVAIPALQRRASMGFRVPGQRGGDKITRAHIRSPSGYPSSSTRSIT